MNILWLLNHEWIVYKTVHDVDSFKNIFLLHNICIIYFYWLNLRWNLNLHWIAYAVIFQFVHNPWWLQLLARFSWIEALYKPFISLFESHAWVSQPHTPTHIAGHTPDLVISPISSLSSHISNISVTTYPPDHKFSDHSLLVFNLLL